MDDIKERIAKGAFIKIVAGEGEVGTVKDYTGRRSLASVLKQLKAERCNGDRWAHAYICEWVSTNDSCWIDIETGESKNLGGYE